MTHKQRVSYIKYLSRRLEDFIDNNIDFGCFHNNSYTDLVYSEYKTKRYLSWRWTPNVVYIPFQYKGEDIYIITEQGIIKKLI